MSQTLKFGNGTWATKKGSILAHNDEGGNFKPLPFTYTGAGKGTRVNKQGLIEVVENDRPRIDYLDSEDGVFLLEEAATNYVTQSNDFSGWNAGYLYVTPNYDISPDGTQNASRCLFTGANQLISTPTSATGTLTGSMYVKGVSGETIQLAAGGLEDLITLNGEWQRLIVTKTNINGIFNLNTFGGATARDLLIFGAMLEQNSHATSYIPTQGTIQTRVQETASGSGNSEVFNDSEGVLYFEGSALANDGTYRYISLSDGSNSNNVRVFLTPTSNQILFEVISGASLKFYYTNNNINVLLNTKILVKYKQSDFSIWINGFNVNSSVGLNGGNTPIGLDRLNFDRGTGDTVYYSKTKELAYYNEVLTDLELETLTSYRSWEAMVKELNLNIIHNE